MLEGALILLALDGRRRRRQPNARPALVAAVRACVLVLIPWTVDVVGHLAPPPAPAPRPPGLLATLSSFGDYSRALVLLLMPVSWLHACFGAATGWQLPPLQHATLHTIMFALLLRRAPRGEPGRGRGGACRVNAAC